MQGTRTEAAESTTTQRVSNALTRRRLGLLQTGNGRHCRGVTSPLTSSLVGLLIVMHPGPDRAAGKIQATALLRLEPYYDTEYYVGFSVNGYEFALDPNADPEVGPVTYWGVPDAAAALTRLVSLGAIAHGPVHDVGDDIQVATIGLPPLIGRTEIIENPHFVTDRPTSTEALPPATP